jgi:hypothetical protein
LEYKLEPPKLTASKEPHRFEIGIFVSYLGTIRQNKCFVPNFALLSRLKIVPGFTSFLNKLVATAASSYGFNSSVFTFIAANTSCSVTFQAFFSGPVKIITRLSSLTYSLSTVLHL